jgi:predicted SprT family Zn-dependent metalloprotease
LGHEVRHRLSGNFLPETETETTLLKSAYDDGFDELTKIHETLKDVDMNPERVTTNFDARKQAIGKHHLLNTNWELQNKIIDKLSDERIFEAVEKSNGYGKKYIKYLRDNNRLTPEKARQFREAMKYVGAVVPFASVGSTKVFNDVNR